MKIIHTADWHIGKILHKQDLYEDISLFFEWLINYITTEKADVILVSGDIFDLANPSNRDIKLFFNTLHKLSKTGVKTIITGGNHDSVSLLNAPASVLKELNIHIVGGVPDDLSHEIIPISDDNGNIQCIVLAVPFLRDKDLRLSVQADVASDKSDTIPQAVQYHYEHLLDMATKSYPSDITVIGMGHLYMKGAITSDSEREIHVGNLLGIESTLIPHNISYMALGHIHKPQRVGKKEHIRYSGSPIYLDFSEAGFSKMIIQLEIDEHNPMTIQEVSIPVFRALIRLKGNLEQVREQLFHYENPNKLITLAEIEITEQDFDSSKINTLQQMAEDPSTQYKMVKSRINFIHDNPEKNSFAVEDLSIHELTPFQILDMRMGSEVQDENSKMAIRSVYAEILQSLTE